MAELLAARRLAPEDDEQSFPPAQQSPLQAPASTRIGPPAKRQHLGERHDGTPTDVSDSGTENAIQYDAHVWALDKLFTRFQGPDPPPPGPMSRNPWLTLETPTATPWDRLRAAKVRRAQADDDENMEPDLKKHDDDKHKEPDLKKNDEDEDMGPAEGPSPSEKPAPEPAAAFGNGEPASVTPTVEMATMDDLNRRFDNMESRFERLFEKNTRLFIQHQDDSTKKLNEKIDEVARLQEKKFVKELQQQQADTSAKFESLTARPSALESPAAAAAPTAARPQSTASAPRGRVRMGVFPEDPWVAEDPWRNHRVGREASGTPDPRPAAT